jgi:hypothetical protein
MMASSIQPLDVFDISNPSMPRQIDEMKYPDPVYNVKVDDGTVYLANAAAPALKDSIVPAP